MNNPKTNNKGKVTFNKPLTKFNVEVKKDGYFTHIEECNNDKNKVTVKLEKHKSIKLKREKIKGDINYLVKDEKGNEISSGKIQSKETVKQIEQLSRKYTIEVSKKNYKTATYILEKYFLTQLYEINISLIKIKKGTKLLLNFLIAVASCLVIGLIVYFLFFNKTDFTKYYADENKLLDSISKEYCNKDWNWLKTNYENSVNVFFNQKQTNYEDLVNAHPDDFDINKINVGTHKNTFKKHYKKTLENEISKFVSDEDFNIETAEFLIQEANKYSINTNKLEKFKFICNKINQAKMLLKGLKTDVTICNTRNVLKCLANNNCPEFSYELTLMQKEKILNYWGKFFAMCKYDWTDALVLIDKMQLGYDIYKRDEAIKFLLEEDIIRESSSGYILNK